MSSENPKFFENISMAEYRHFAGAFERPFFCTIDVTKEVRKMYDRLLALGFTEQMAMDILTLFPDPDELRTYVYFAELFHV